MKNGITAINENIHKITTPYKDIFTTVCTVSTPEGVLLFDCASFDEDVEKYVLPMLGELKITTKKLKYIFISHNHKDHSGALGELLKHFPDVTVLSRSPELKKKYADFKVYCPEDGEVFLGCLKTVTIPGHTEDSTAILDNRTSTLITGDCLQLYGIFGSQDWGANIGFPTQHLEAVEKVRKFGVENIYTAHDYHPCGTCACGKEAVERMLDMCVEPIEKVRKLIDENPSADDMEIRAIYNAHDRVPTISTRVVIAVREAILKGKM